MSEPWPKVPIREVLRRSEELIELQPDMTYRQVTVRLWGGGVVERGKVLGSEIASDRQFVVRPNQFIISRIDARNGASGLVPEELNGAVVTNDFPIFRVNRDRLNSDYLKWLSQTEGFVSLCRSASEGTTNRVRLKEDRFLAMELPLPSLPEQQRIVARIEEIASRIISALRLQEEVDGELAAFVSSLHVQMASGREVGVGTFLELHEEQEVIVSERVYPQVGIRGFGGGLFAKSAVAGEDTTYKFFNRLFDGALVLSQVKGWEGAIGVSDQRMAGWYVSPEYRTFRCVPGQADPDYLRHLVANQWFWKHLKSLSRGVGARRERTRPEQFLALRMLMPIVERQQQAAQTLGTGRKQLPDFTLTGEQPDSSTWGETRRTQSSWSS
jgi:type I restriction enzyme, S subunit